MKLSSIILSCTVIVWASAVGLVHASSPDDALSRWEALSKTSSPQEIMACYEDVRAAYTRGDRTVVERLLAIAGADSQSEYSRALALPLACDLADRDGSCRVLEYLEGRLAVLEHWGSKIGATSDNVFGASSQLNAFVARGAESLAETVDDQNRFLLLLASIYACGWIEDEGREKCVKMIVESKAPLASRRAAALNIVELSRRHTRLSIKVLDLLDSSVFPQLRQLVRAKTDPREFHFAAADALSYHGDLQMVADLERQRQAFAPEHKNFAKYLQRYLWRIEVQNPATKLLDHIAGLEPSHGREIRSWAVRRAHKLGVDPARIREAILQYERDASTPGERAWLPGMKCVGLELSILKETDLPDVEIPKYDVVP